MGQSRCALEFGAGHKNLIHYAPGEPPSLFLLLGQPRANDASASGLGSTVSSRYSFPLDTTDLGDEIAFWNLVESRCKQSRVLTRRCGDFGRIGHCFAYEDLVKSGFGGEHTESNHRLM